jgi:membrane fusion protein (multidrug efflux system)
MATEIQNQSDQRKRVLVILAVVALLAGLAYFAWWALHGRYHETTDDAYVAGNQIRVTPRVPGTAVAVLADDSDYVKRGQVLVRLDDTDARVALDRSEADLADAVRRVRQGFDLVKEREANLALKQETLHQAEADLERRGGAAAEQEAVSQEEIEHARSAVTRARNDFQLTQAQFASAHAAVGGTTIDNHPAVMQAAARVRDAYLAGARCEIRAAENGYVAKRSVQVGQQVAVGVPLMALVPLDQLWVEANFKEDQLRRLRIGQPVELVSDLYGSDPVFHGTVAGLDPGTGAAFSLLPPQNASGNWIKIVQRLPVRVTLDPKELAEHPLLVGLSLKANVDTHDQGGSALATSASARHYETTVYDDAEKDADVVVRRIIAANRGS